MAGALTDVAGVRVGHWTDGDRHTGCTVVLLPDEGAVTGVDVRGAAPGTRETDLLDPSNQVQVAHAILLTGGSAFGLGAADGVMRHLEERGIGIPTPAGPVPIVPGAVLFDLKPEVRARPDAEAGYEATVAAERGEPCRGGPVGAGAGATVGKLFGPESTRASGLGTAARRLPGGGVVGALVAVNAVGDVVADDGSLLAGAGTVERLLAEGAPPPPIGTNTTLAVVATDVSLTQSLARRLAMVAHDGFARAIRPVHTAYDGDTVFAVSTERVTYDPATELVLQTAVVEVVAAAIRDAVSE